LTVRTIAALWMGSRNHAEDAVPHQRVTARQPDRVRDSDPKRDEPDTSTPKSGSVGARGGKLPRATRPEIGFRRLSRRASAQVCEVMDAQVARDFAQALSFRREVAAQQPALAEFLQA
jgi:hypothetical protein